MALLILLAVGFFSYRAILSFSEVASLRGSAFATSSALDDVLALVKDAESGQRGYLITGEYQYLEPYAAAREAMEARFAKLRRLASADGVAMERLDRISVLIDDKFVELADGIGLRRERGFDAAAGVVETDRGLKIMEEIRELIAAIRAENQERVAARNAELSRQVRLAKFLTLFGSGVAFAYVFGSALLIRRDFTRRTRQQADLFRRLIETAEAIILVRDLEGRVLLYNGYTERLCGHPLAEMRGKDWITTVVPEPEQPRMRDLFARVLEDGEAEGYLSSLRTRDGAVRTIDWHTQVLDDGAGTVVGVLSTGRDVTERRAEEKETEERERLADIGAISAKLAHDLGNPLSAIALQAQAMLRAIERDGGRPLGTLAKPVGQLVSEVHRLEAFIHELLDFAREQRLEVRPVDVPQLLDDVVRLWHPVASARDIALRTEIRDGLGDRLVADENKLHRVLDNLVKNALEALGDGPGEVRLRVEAAEPHRARISVEDTGPGVGNDVQLFRLFETTKQHGTGLGLAVSKQILIAHGGDLSFTPREPHGAVFSMDLPLRRD